MAEKWYCSECGQRFNRGYDIVRQDARGHLNRFHYGQGAPVRWAQLREEHRFQVNNAYEDKIRGLSEVPNNSQRGRSYADRERTYRDHSRDKNRGFSLERLSQRIQDAWNERIENLVVADVLNQLPTPGSSLPRWLPTQASSFQGQVGLPQKLAFGYISHGCPECHFWEPLEVYYPVESSSLCDQRVHLCPDRMIEFKDHSHGWPLISPYARRIRDIEFNEDTHVRLLKEFMQRKCQEKSRPIQLAAFKIDVSNRGHTQDGREQPLVACIPHPDKNKKLYAFLACGRNKCIGLVRPKDSFHWINRILHDRTTCLGTREFEEFLHLAGAATFVFVKVNTIITLETEEGTSSIVEEEYYLITFDEEDWSGLARGSKGYEDSIWDSRIAAMLDSNSA